MSFLLLVVLSTISGFDYWQLNINSGLCYAVETTVKQIEDAFKEFTAREDIAIVLISQYVSELSHLDLYSFLYTLKRQYEKKQSESILKETLILLRCAPCNAWIASLHVFDSLLYISGSDRLQT